MKSIISRTSRSWIARFACVIALSSFSIPAFSADPANKLCPIMTDDEVDAEYIVQSGGVPVGLCCGKCDKLWKKNEKYYIKAGLELGLLPQFKGRETELGLDKVELLPQRFCPINEKNIVTPDSPSIGYKGVKVYFYNEAALKKWEAAPDATAEKAVKAGLLPQLAKK
jgi:hypothetical protein